MAVAMMKISNMNGLVFHTSIMIIMFINMRPVFQLTLAFTNKILNEGQSAIDKYLGFLKAGESNYPLEVLKEAGLDMSSNQVIKEAMQLFAQRLDEFAELLK